MHIFRGVILSIDFFYLFVFCVVAELREKYGHNCEIFTVAVVMISGNRCYDWLISFVASFHYKAVGGVVEIHFDCGNNGKQTER